VSKGWFAVGAIIGFVIGCGAAFLYLNVDPLERTAAAADGFSRWSPWQLPFTLPWGVLGGVAGIVAALVVHRFRRGIRDRSSPAAG
jgi:H+/Cl- antiporter ClcA